MNAMNELERLDAIESIRQLKARYYRCLDTKDWAGLETVFAPDVYADMREAVEDYDPAATITGAHSFAQSIKNAVEGLDTVHHGHTPEIEITSPTAARGIWAMEDKLWKQKNSTSTLPFDFLHGYGHYHETYEKVSGHWLIKTTKLTRLRVDLA